MKFLLLACTPLLVSSYCMASDTDDMSKAEREQEAKEALYEAKEEITEAMKELAMAEEEMQREHKELALRSKSEHQQEIRRARKEMALAKAEMARARQEMVIIRQDLDSTDPLKIVLDSRKGKRALIGIVMNDSDHGVVLSAVSPGSSAEEIGMKAGDVITHINKQAINHEDRDTRVSIATKLIGRPKEGEKVHFSILRGDKKMSFEPAAKALDLKNISFTSSDGSDIDVEFIIESAMDGLHDSLETMNVKLNNMDFDTSSNFKWATNHSAPFAELLMNQQLGQVNMVKLNPELKSYFGTKEGVLLLEIDDDNAFKFKAGDVISSIDSRDITSPSHMMRVLRSYNSGDKLNIKIYRDKRKKTLKVAMPEDDKIGSLFGQGSGTPNTFVHTSELSHDLKHIEIPQLFSSYD